MFFGITMLGLIGQIFLIFIIMLPISGLYFFITGITDGEAGEAVIGFIMLLISAPFVYEFIRIFIL